jgi:hypothetical protein
VPIGVPSAAAGGLASSVAAGAPAGESVGVAGVTAAGAGAETADSSTSREAEEVAGVQAAGPSATVSGASPLANVVANVLPSTGGPGAVLVLGLAGLAGAGVCLRRFGRSR